MKTRWLFIYCDGGGHRGRGGIPDGVDHVGQACDVRDVAVYGGASGAGGVRAPASAPAPGASSVPAARDPPQGGGSGAGGALARGGGGLGLVDESLVNLGMHIVPLELDENVGKFPC